MQAELLSIAMANLPFQHAVKSLQRCTGSSKTPTKRLPAVYTCQNGGSSQQEQETVSHAHL